MNMEELNDLAITYGGRLLTALLTLLIGLWVIKLIVKALSKMMDKRQVDPSLKPFLISLSGTLLKVMLVITTLGMLGIEMTSFIAILGAAGLAVGMAMSGTLQNFAGGVMILIFKPFKAGDFIEAQGFSGVVKEIQIFNTILKTGDNKTVIIPNGGLSTGSMVNYSTEPTRRVDMTFGIGYGDDTSKGRAVLQSLVDSDKRILKDPAPFIAVSDLADSSVNFVVRSWVNSADYWGVYFDMNDKVYNEFNKQGLNIPYPQMDVHLHNNNK